MVARFVPFAHHLHQLVAHGVLLLLGFVGVQLPIRFGVWLGVSVGRVWNEGVRLVNRRLGSPVQSRHDAASLVAVDGEAALAGNLDQLWGRTGRRRQRDVAGAEGHAAHRPVNAGALVLATSAEVLAVLVNAAVIFTGAPLRLG